MVKIRDLTNQQIVEQLKKYFKFITALDNERKKRIAQGANEEQLYTSEELEARSIAEVSRIKNPGKSASAESTTIFHLKMDENQLDELAENAVIGNNGQVSVSDLLNQSESEQAGSKAEGAFREIESDVTSHKLDLAPKKGKKRIIKKK